MSTSSLSSIDFESLRYLSVSAEAGNFGRAAQSLGVQTSTVSRSIARLEDALGLTLFERGHFGVRLTGGGKAVMVHVRRVLADLEALKTSASCNGSGTAGQIRLGVRTPPIGQPVQPLLEAWRTNFPQVDLTLFEMNERDIRAGIEERRLDVALMATHTLWPHAVAEPIYREPLMLALPAAHRLVRHRAVRWDDMRAETLLVQGWDESQAAREFCASVLGSGVRFRAHPASQESVLTLVGAGFGVSLVTASQTEMQFPGVVFKSIAENNANVETALVWVRQNEEAVVGRFVAFMRDEARSRQLL